MCRPASNTGWPAHRLVVAYHGPSSAPDLTATLYVYDHNSQRYYQVGTGTLKAEQLNYFSIVSIAEPPVRADNMDQNAAGGMELVLIVTPPSPGIVGTYVFSMAPDLVQQ